VRFDEFVDLLEANIAKAVEAEAMLLASEIRANVPVNRIKTRQAVRARVNAARARISLRFPQRYPGTETPTHDWFRKQWRTRRPIARRRLLERLRNIFNG
jgi:hypothetical protein